MNHQEMIQVKAEEIAADLIMENVKIIEELQERQRTICTDPYMMGLYNGMELAKAIFTGNEPVFLAQDVIGRVVEAIDIEEVSEDENSGQ